MVDISVMTSLKIIHIYIKIFYFLAPFFDPDESDDSVTVIYAGFMTTITMKEENKEDSCIAVATVTG